MNNPYKYDAVVVDPDLPSRMRLKQATTAVPAFGSVQLTGSLDEALGRITSCNHCDVVFVSHRFEKEDLNSFIKKAKETKQGQDAAYVMVLQSKEGSSAKVAESVLGGADGMLFEPYSVDYLYEITNLAARVKKERSDAREKAAIGVLIQDIIQQIDQIAYLRSCNMETGRAFKKLKETCGVLTSLSPGSGEAYYQMAVEAFENAQIPVNVSKYKKYGGVSDRIKKRMEKKVIAEMEAKTGGPTETPPDEKKES